METSKLLPEVNSTASGLCSKGGKCQCSVVVNLPLGDSHAQFNLEKAVCSHGLFMMAPNQWDSLSKTFQRPLRLHSDDVNNSLSHMVQISQPSDTPESLELRVFGLESLSPHNQQTLLEQVRRMLRLSEGEEAKLRAFREIYGASAKDKGFGRLFRSPTLFEDMVKCILLCNCQWPRTLSMARALCELQLELQCPSFTSDTFKSPANEADHFAPNTPAGKESKRGAGKRVHSTNQGKKLIFPIEEEEFFEQHDSSKSSIEALEVNSVSVIQPSSSFGNFPSPRELASLNEELLAKRCGLGYRANRIINLAQSVVEGRIQLKELEKNCDIFCLSNYNKLAEQLQEINGFGPYTCSNVLMCMGFYHMIPADSETIRHLKQFHRKTSNIRDIQRDIETIYGKFAPFQFLVYWSEVWSFYEERFGRLSDMPQSEYKLITAANLRQKKGNRSKKTKIS